MQRTAKSCGPDASTAAVIVRESGRPSIPETSLVESGSRGALDTPHARAMTADCASGARIFSPLWDFPLSRKRFMVPRGFVGDEVKLSINIKGLA
jgi:hypothetical protein